MPANGLARKGLERMHPVSYVTTADRAPLARRSNRGERVMSDRIG